MDRLKDFGNRQLQKVKQILKTKIAMQDVSRHHENYTARTMQNSKVNSVALKKRKEWSNYIFTK